MTPQQYQTKLANLAMLMKGYQVVALQEAGESKNAVCGKMQRDGNPAITCASQRFPSSRFSLICQGW